jgi:hypothetical protein
VLALLPCFVTMLGRFALAKYDEMLVQTIDLLASLTRFTRDEDQYDLCLLSFLFVSS